MKVLIACEFSGIVRDAFLTRGHDAWSCDIIPTESDNKENHIQGYVETILNDGWDLMIAHPPCTYLCNSGVRWYINNVDRQIETAIAGIFFNRLLNATIKKICVENPVPHKYGLKWMGRKYDQIIQPWMFGHGETKRTCLWLKNLPKLVPTNIVDGREARIHRMAPSKDRGKLRSIFYTGIAEAMATQWGG